MFLHKCWYYYSRQSLVTHCYLLISVLPQIVFFAVNCLQTLVLRYFIFLWCDSTGTEEPAIRHHCPLVDDWMGKWTIFLGLGQYCRVSFSAWKLLVEWQKGMVATNLEFCATSGKMDFALLVQPVSSNPYAAKCIWCTKTVDMGRKAFVSHMSSSWCGMTLDKGHYYVYFLLR